MKFTMHHCLILIYFTFNFIEALLFLALSLAYITSVVPFFCRLMLIAYVPLELTVALPR